MKLPHLLGCALVVALGATACTGSPVPEPSAQLAVAVDTAGDPRQERAMSLAHRYAGGTFALELDSAAEADTNGHYASHSSTVLVFTVDDDVDEVVARLRDEPFVLDVTKR